MLAEAHIHDHRVGRVCDHLSPEEEVVYQTLKRKRTRELKEDGLVAYLEPKRFSVNWRQELLNVLETRELPDNVEAFLRERAADARDQTRKARKLFEKEAPNWRDETRHLKRLVIRG